MNRERYHIVEEVKRIIELISTEEAAALIPELENYVRLEGHKVTNARRKLRWLQARLLGLLTDSSPRTGRAGSHCG